MLPKCNWPTQFAPWTPNTHHSRLWPTCFPQFMFLVKSHQHRYRVFPLKNHFPLSLLCCYRLWSVWGFGVDQWLRKRDLLRLCGFSRATRQHQGTTRSNPQKWWRTELVEIIAACQTQCSKQSSIFKWDWFLSTESSEGRRFSEWPHVLGVMSLSRGPACRSRSRWRGSRGR